MSLLSVVSAVPASADTSTSTSLLFHHRSGGDVWHVDFTGAAEAAPAVLTADFTTTDFTQPVTPPAELGADFTQPIETGPGAFPADLAQPVHAAAIQHSDAYLTRAKIHRYASFASLPLFALEVYLGESLYNSASNNNKGLHVFVGTALVGLFGVNTVTGAWNMFGTEGRSDKQDRTIRLVHGLLMMAADVGFVATVATAPHSHRFTVPSQSARTLHRNVALTAIGLGTAGYMIMFVHNF